MLCLPVFIILLLLASPAAPNPLQTRIQSNLIRAGPEDANMKTDKRVISGLLAGILVPLIDAIMG
uniref:Conotoxin VnMLCL-042 n=1 Tax=Conus ventricosus TaxID=117992 RepID=CT0C4_CONVE|nr:RecName: Full=Conotoxin VnMLCL-042; Flags: Precursor [Conus ventricosus]AAG60429.1 conotoxin precursor [Conus ventricosus]